VLDPACGSGNFLYVAYRELRALEQRLHEREVELRKQAGIKDQGSLSLHFPLQNMRGIEIDGFAVALARVTLWMGHKLAVDRLGLDESTLPLADLSGIRVGDALRMDWPRADAIIGNPPFHGDRHLRRVLGDDYVEWLKSEFGVGVKDYSVYWFRKAHDQLESGGRAGLVGTNSISQNRARSASLEYVVENGGVLTNAVSTQDWPGRRRSTSALSTGLNDQQPNPVCKFSPAQRSPRSTRRFVKPLVTRRVACPATEEWRSRACCPVPTLSRTRKPQPGFSRWSRSTKTSSGLI
jgi:hypothetical protein